MIGLSQNAATNAEPHAFYPVVIIGAGMSGIATACQLKRKLGLDHFRLFESQDDLGGTWNSHVYPGVACDIPAQLYSFSFAPNPKWSSPKPRGQEIKQYLVDVCRQHGILGNMEFNTKVQWLRWDEEWREWEVGLIRTSEGKQYPSDVGKETPTIPTIRAKVVISAVGKFRDPNLSVIHDIPGIESFTGSCVHTALWKRSSVDLNNKRITVIGTGCSAAQLVPELLSATNGNVKSVAQLMRSPPWVVPDPVSGPWLECWKRCIPWLMSNIPGAMRITRFILFCICEAVFFLFYPPFPKFSIVRVVVERWLSRYAMSIVPERYCDMITPKYAIGCKRVVYHAGWLRSLCHPKLQLYAKPVKRFERDSVIIGEGTKETAIRTDVLILATGYEANTLLHSMKVTGRDGVDLHQTWEDRDGAQGYLGIAMDKFPNFFIVYGPNASNGHTSVLILIENTIKYILKLVKPVLDMQVDSWEVTEPACTNWTRKIQAASSGSVWVTGGCTSWYTNDQKWNAMIYP